MKTTWGVKKKRGSGTPARFYVSPLGLLTRNQYLAYLKQKKNESLHRLNMSLGIAVMSGNYNSAEKIARSINRLK
jgi:hypothetical protein